MPKTLLLNQSYETISFISFRSLIKLIVKDKVEIIENWDEEISWISGKIKLPAIVRMKYYVRKNSKLKIKFNRKAVFRRDLYLCCYCGLALTPGQITMDHIVPSSLGGASSWLNCISSCMPCNSKKANKTPDQAGMKLLKNPFIPEKTLNAEYILIKQKHDSWADYF